MAAVTRWLAVCLVAVTAAAPPARAADNVGAVDPATGEWHIRRADGSVRAFTFGDPGDHPFMGDWDCDGIDTAGLYRRSDGYVYLRNTNSTGIADIAFYFGNPGDVPVAGDFNGDGCDTVSVYRPSTQQFFVIDRLGSGDAGLGAATLGFVFGDPGDQPFAGDFDGDGRDTFGLHRASTGLVYYRDSLSTGVAHSSFIFGDPSDRFVAGDWSGDGVDTVGVYR
jgi:hypothetical protein